MDFMKAFDQTVREIKREVNLKVLKVPEIEQKVLDATSDEPWGPHGSDLSEIARATKKFTECQMVMNVLWTRLAERGPNWRLVYKALTIIEYLIANGSERAIDDILDRCSKISVLSKFEYVELNGKDSGINVRKKVETIMGVLNDKERIKAVRDKAAANRDKYVGLSSTGITYKSSSSSFSSSNYDSSDRYGSLSSSREAESFGDSYKNKESIEKETELPSRYTEMSNEDTISKNGGSKRRKEVTQHSRTEDPVPSSYLRPPTKPDNDDNDFDDFDPRGSSTTRASNNSSSQMDLFSPNLMDDFIDAPVSATTSSNNATPQAEVDLFADADFQSAVPTIEAAAGKDPQGHVDLFAGQSAFAAAFPPKAELFPKPSSVMSSESNPTMIKNTSAEGFDPFSAIPLNSFEGSDPFGTFASSVATSTVEPSNSSGVDLSGSNNDFQAASDFGAFVSHTETAATDTPNNSLRNGAASNPDTKKGAFQVKSGIWADSLSRGLIDLNITAPKKVNLANIGIVGDLSDGSDEKEKGFAPPVYMGRAMGTGSGPVMAGFASSTATGGIASLSAFSQQQFGAFK